MDNMQSVEPRKSGTTFSRSLKRLSPFGGEGQITGHGQVILTGYRGHVKFFKLCDDETTGRAYGMAR
ncbi:hypothetical protein AAL_05638 [Moelleriella libera RCEF 2490]|uniref:Uncharacterized protein n=1 Tax=Moelleriella libera RCEF 2490 TaxID=1081109 RepID=A0A162IGX1_9HYPO|nr:hypothetical protein AAL_05638 [Moelleriella libera RCEF 2490]